MKTLNTIIKSALVAAVSVFALASCEYDPYEHDITLPAEKLSLDASKEAVVMTEETLQQTAIEFTWTPAREVSDEYLVTYTTKLDVVGNNFGSTTAIVHEEEEGVYSRSFTVEQINAWFAERWKLPVNQDFILEFRVTVEFTGGPEFQAPEVRTVRVKVSPIHIDIFAADKVYIDGTSTEGAEEIFKTVENDQKYAWYGTLAAGTLSLPVEYDGAKYFIHPKASGESFVPGQVFDVTMNENEQVLKIPAAGKYRIIIDMKEKTAQIYDEATDLKPFVATFRPNGADANPETSIEVTNLWAYGGGTGWGVRDLQCKISAADPQILTYEGSFNGGVKFCISKSFTVGGTSYNQNNSYCFTNPLKEDGTRQNLTLAADKESPLYGSASGEARNSYYGMPSGNRLYIFNLREMTIIAKSL